jgi:3-methyladenine DNA glycosylase AlkC
MSALLKDIYSEPFYDRFSEVLNHTLTSFDRKSFKTLIFNDEFTSYELKQRMAHTAKVLGYFLDDDFGKATQTIRQIINTLRDTGIEEDSLEFMFLPEYIAMHGLDDYAHSISAIEFITQFTSCEFAVRPFILKYENRMLAQMQDWSKHENYRVRRLASEGSRPRLPWAIALPGLIKNPRPVLPILENLKQDASETVRRSVANHLNDISKDNPEIALKTAKKWHGKNGNTNAIVKHACRTLLKQGHPDVLKLFGFDSRHIVLNDFRINRKKVRLGGELEFSFSILNTHKKNQKVRLEYGVYYRKKNGGVSRKVFKISERDIEPGKPHIIKRKQSFRLITTRKYYTGGHQLSIIINGQESKLKEFELTN